MAEKTSLKDRLQKNKSSLFGVSGDLPRIFEVSIEALRANPAQPRQNFDEIALQDLAKSIDRHGLLQPIAVMPDDTPSRYIIVAGERRFRAHQILKREVIPAIIVSGNSDELALIENLQRENLDPIEEAESLKNIKQNYGYSDDDLAEIVGKSRVSVTESLSLNDLPEEVKQEARSHPRVTRSLLIEIGRTSDKAAVWQAFKEYGLNVRDIRKIKEQEKTTKPHTGEPKATPLNSLVVSQALSLNKRLKQAQESSVVFNEEELGKLKDAYGTFTALLENAEGRSE